MTEPRARLSPDPGRLLEKIGIRNSSAVLVGSGPKRS
jgi:hypothetical protein